MEHSQHPPVALRVPKRAVLIIASLVGIVVILIAASTLFFSNQADQLEAISAYQTQCWIGTQGAESYVFIYNFYGTSTPTPSATSIVAALTEIAQQPTLAPDLSATPSQPVLTPTLSAQLIRPDAARGEVVFKGVGACAACHDTQRGIASVGPTLLNIAAISQARFPDISPELYLKESILLPNAYIVPGFSADIMPKNYGTTLTNAQINDLIAYMMTIK